MTTTVRSAADPGGGQVNASSTPGESQHAKHPEDSPTDAVSGEGGLGPLPLVNEDNSDAGEERLRAPAWPPPSRSPYEPLPYAGKIQIIGHAGTRFGVVGSEVGVSVDLAAHGFEWSTNLPLDDSDTQPVAWCAGGHRGSVVAAAADGLIPKQV